ncbi:MAG: methionine synthase, partial [Actinobacteria bacterium]
MRDFIETINSRVVVYDGGMGATLEQFDLSSEDYGGLPGKCHEALVLHRPDVIKGVHESMLEAGADVVETDTFQGSRLKLDEWGLGDHTVEINTRAAQIGREAAGEERFVAGSIGPTGMLPASDDPTLGNISFGKLVEVFTEQARGLIEGGADLIIIETAQDILEVKAAVLGAREAFKETGRTLPIQTSVSLLPQGGKMLLGTDIQAVLTTLSALDVQVIGLNCSTGPGDMRDAIRFLGEHSSVPVHCIPNAGLPIQGPGGETIFPEQPDPLASMLQEFVERYGVTIVGGCCGTTPDHIRAIAERVKGREAPPRPKDAWAAHLSSMMTATPLEQEPRPAMVGERVNSQGSRKAKELLLADDYDGLVQVAEDQVEGGAHLLDVCVALTERQDEADQMREVVKRISLTQPAPIQIDSTEPEVIKTALEQIPGRAIVNSINLEAGRAKADTVIPLARAHGAALIALTIDEEGMAKTADRKVEVAKRIREIACDEHGLDPEVLIFDVLTFTLTTGDEEWRPSAIETIEGIRRVKAELPGVKTSLGVSNVSFGVSPPARAVLNSVFLHHAVDAGL